MTNKDDDKPAGEKLRSLLDIMDSLSMPGLAEIEFDPPRLDLSIRPADFSGVLLDNSVRSEIPKARTDSNKPQGKVEPEV